MPGKKIMIVDDDLAMIMNLEEVLPRNGYAVTGACQSAKEALTMAPQVQPDAALIEINLGQGMDGIELARRLMASYRIPPIFITGYDSPQLPDRAKECRPLAYVVKPFSENQLLADIKLGLFRIKSQEAQRDASHRDLPHALPPEYKELTPTELRVAALVMQGKSCKEVARILSISITTVQWHRKHIRKKLRLTNTDKNLVTSLMS